MSLSRWCCVPLALGLVFALGCVETDMRYIPMADRPMKTGILLPARLPPRPMLHALMTTAGLAGKDLKRARMVNMGVVWLDVKALEEHLGYLKGLWRKRRVRGAKKEIKLTRKWLKARRRTFKTLRLYFPPEKHLVDVWESYRSLDDRRFVRELIFTFPDETQEIDERVLDKYGKYRQHETR